MTCDQILVVSNKPCCWFFERRLVSVMGERRDGVLAPNVGLPLSSASGRMYGRTGGRVGGYDAAETAVPANRPHAPTPTRTTAHTPTPRSVDLFGVFTGVGEGTRRRIGSLGAVGRETVRRRLRPTRMRAAPGPGAGRWRSGGRERRDGGTPRGWRHGRRRRGRPGAAEAG